MAVSNPRDVPEYEVNPMDLQFRRGEDAFKVCCCLVNHELLCVIYYMELYKALVGILRDVMQC